MAMALRWMCPLFVWSITALPADGTATPFGAVPLMHDLDLQQVQLVVVAAPDVAVRFSERTRRLFAQAGLPLAPPDQPHSPPSATLKLTLNPTPLNETCPGNVLYEPSFALIEPVIVPRNSGLMHDITWIAGIPPQARAPVGVEELEVDLDGFVQKFIASYKLGNPEWRSPRVQGDRKNSGGQHVVQGPPGAVVPEVRADVSLKGLDADTLQLSVLAGRWTEPLTTRALDQLTNAGLPVSLEQHGRDSAILSLELIQNPIEGQCSGKVLYETGLFLVEQVRITRNPQLLVWSDTWARERVEVVPPVTLQQAELDQDALLKQFIRSFQAK